MTTFDSAAQLKASLLQTEKKLGIVNLSHIQKNIIYVAVILPKNNGVLETSDIRKHDLLKGVSRSSFFRALKAVVSAGYFIRSNDRERSCYKLAAKLRIEV